MELKLELSEEKTLITHSANYARFLGYDIRVRRNNQIKRDSRGFSKRTLSNIVELNVPLKDKIERYLFDNDIVEQVNGELRSKKRNGLIRFTDLEILRAFFQYDAYVWYRPYQVCGNLSGYSSFWQPGRCILCWRLVVEFF